MNKPKILIYDIETTPHLSYTWGKYDQNVIAFKDYSKILSVAYKWHGEKKVHSSNGNEKSLVTLLWVLFNEADAVVAHNGNAFDTKRCYAYFSKFNMKPPAPFRQIDTKLIAKKHFSFPSNSLNDLADYLGIGRKKETGGFELWLKCMQGDKKAWKTMLEYNENDVVLLEKVYLRLLPYITENLRLYAGEVCPTCGSDSLISRGEVRTISAIFQRVQCKSCGHWARLAKRKETINTLRNI